MRESDMILPPETIIAILVFVAVVLIVAYHSARGYSQQIRRRMHPMPLVKDQTGMFDEQVEFDMRLPYKRFKQLYPLSDITYKEYKKLQVQHAFKRAVGSQRNKRMVR
jgi:hypothetical protein